MSVREDFLEAYAAQTGRSRTYTEGMLDKVGADYIEADRVARDKRVEELRQPGCPAQDPAEREGENFSLTRQVTRLSAFVEMASEVAKSFEKELERACNELDARDGARMQEESPVIKRLLEENEELRRKLEGQQ